MIKDVWTHKRFVMFFLQQKKIFILILQKSSDFTILDF